VATSRPVGRFSTDPRSVSDARRFAARAVTPVHPDLCDAVMLLVSELATNAIRHGRSDYSVDARVLPAGVRVEVTDRGPGETGGSAASFPAAASGHALSAESSSPESGGRGLRIVEALADVWGVVAKPPEAGRMVWFEMRANRPGPAH
jgi:anti-sigma regulatory factor (Ser/Thr protein kinase)